MEKINTKTPPLIQTDKKKSIDKINKPIDKLDDK